MINSIMIKPVGDLCNLRCSYCYYRGASPDPDKLKTLELGRVDRFLKEWLSQGPQQVTISFQGGEPTLAGLKWFEDFFAKVEGYRRSGQQVRFALQTNGLQFDRAWAGLLKSYAVLVGLSIDGPQTVHDHYRRGPQGEGSFQRVQRAARLLLEEAVEVNAIVLLNDRNVGQARELYDFLKGQGFDWLQFIPCVEWDQQGQLRSFCVNGQSYGQFLLDLFEAWYPGDVGRVFVRYFESALIRITGLPGGLCYLQKYCEPGLTIERDGSVYGCDHFVKKPWRLGSIDDPQVMHWDTHPLYMQFSRQKAELSKQCLSCKYLELCGGGCQKHRSRQNQMNVLCPAYRQFFDKNLGRLQRLIGQARSRRNGGTGQAR